MSFRPLSDMVLCVVNIGDLIAIHIWAESVNFDDFRNKAMRILQTNMNGKIDQIPDLTLQSIMWNS